MATARILLTAALWLFSTGVGAEPTDLTFTASAPEFSAATQQYREIWEQDGPRILGTLDRFIGASLPDRHIEVIVFEGMSSSGRRGNPMRLRASYPEDVKRATLVHELLHRYLGEIKGIPACYPEVHDLMSAILLEVWTELWGREFAFEQAAVESGRAERYRASWSIALAMSESQRQEEIARLRRAEPRLCTQAEHGNRP